MRKIVWFFSVSLDGFIAAPDGGLEWQIIDAEIHQHFNAVLREMGGFLDGRVTYQLMASYWPTADQDPSSTPEEAEFSGIWRDMPKVVYSRTLQEAGWNTRIEREVDPAAVRALKAARGGDLVLGGADLGATFLSLGLIDEFRFYVHPVVLGAGKPLFGPAADKQERLQLLETHRFGSGVLLVRWALSRPDGAANR